MLVIFEMHSENLHTSYKVFGKKQDNILTFPDKSIPNTQINVTILEDSVEINRTGSVQMLQRFKENEKLSGWYKNNENIELNTDSFTKELLIEENQITILYDHYVENDYQSTNKLIIKY